MPAGAPGDPRAPFSPFKPTVNSLPYIFTREAKPVCVVDYLGFLVPPALLVFRPILDHQCHPCILVVPSDLRNPSENQQLRVSQHIFVSIFLLIFLMLRDDLSSVALDGMEIRNNKWSYPFTLRSHKARVSPGAFHAWFAFEAFVS